MHHWSWFYLLPGISDGSSPLFALSSEAGKHGAHTIPAAWTVFFLLTAVSLMVRRNLVAARAQGGTLQYVPDVGLGARNVMELLISALLNLMETVFGDRKNAIRYFPLIGTLFLYILVSNLMGVVPGVLPPTSDMSTNLAMSLVVFMVFNIAGIKANGLGYFKHLMGPLLAIAPMILFLEVVGLIVRPASLSLRLLGNMTGDHLVLGIFSDLVPFVIPAIFLFLGIFVSFIQALVFSLLSVVYVALAVAHHDDH
jgi:F-type H+-transporting ATPase subunit a